MAHNSNVLTLTMSEYGQLIPFIAETRLPVVTWGVKAVGKTTKIQEWTEANGYRLQVLHLATQDVVDLIGMPNKTPDDADSAELHRLIEKSSLGEELTDVELQWVKSTMLANKTKTSWSRPCWLHNDGIPTAYHLDEMNRSNKFVSAAMLPFLLEGRLHQHSIGPKDFIIASCNPSTGRYSVNDAFEHDEALKDRCGHIILAPTKEEFIDYASNKIDPVTISVIKKHPKFVELESFDLPFKVEPSRRSIVNVMRHVGKKPDRWLRQNGRLVMGCYLGKEFLETWWETKFKNSQYLEITDLINFDQNRQRIIDSIQAIIDGTETVKSDIYEASVDSIIQWIDTEYKDGISRLEWMFKYFSLSFIPKDSIVAMLTKTDILTKPYLAEAFYDSHLLDYLPEIKEINDFNKLLLEGAK